MEAAFGFVEDVVGCAADNNGYGFGVFAVAYVEEFVVADFDFFDLLSFAKGVGFKVFDA